MTGRTAAKLGMPIETDWDEWKLKRSRQVFNPMKLMIFQRDPGVAGALAVVALLSSLGLAQEPRKPVRGEPIKAGGAVRGEPIKPAAPATVPATPAVPAPAPAPAPEGAGAPNSTDAKYQDLGFDKLAGFNYVVPEYAGTAKPTLPDTNQIPAAIKAYDGKPVALKGFMLPLKVEQGKVTELLLMRDQSMCCFGSVPKINEFITVKMVGGGTRAVMDQAVTLYGKLRVGEFMENGYLLGIYQLDGEKASGPGL